MDQRKLIRFGKSAYCITLPHAWIKKNSLSKGDNIAVIETLRNSLEIASTNLPSIEHESLEIDISGKSIDDIINLLMATYLNGYSKITLNGQNSGKVALIRKHVQEFIAAEIMEVTFNRIVIHIFWDIKNINLDTIIHRTSIIIKSINTETIELLDRENNIKDITEKGLEVQRQVLLGRRAIKYALNHSSVAQKFGLTPLELLYVSYLIYFFGMIAEYIILIALTINAVNFTKILKPKTKKELRTMMKKVSEYFSAVLAMYNKKDVKVKFVLSEYQEFEKSLNSFREKNYNVNIQIIAEYLKMITAKIKETQMMMISMENVPK